MLKPEIKKNKKMNTDDDATTYELGNETERENRRKENIQ